MGNSVSSTTRTISTGDMVVPVNEIVKLLQSKLTEIEINDLLNSLLAGTERQVRPGDLITANLMNQILAELGDLRVRVVRLEGGTTVSGKVEIIEPNTSRTLRIGEKMLIVGRQLGIDSKVRIEEELIESFEPGSDENLLIVSAIPSVANIPQVGRLATLTVSNSRGSASTKFWLKQPEITIPTGRLTVNLFEEPQEPKFEADHEYFFTYRILAVADIDETYSLHAFTDLGWQTVPVDGQDKEIKPPEIFIKRGEPLSAGTYAFVRVKVTIAQGTPDDVEAKLQLQVTSKLNPQLTDSSEEYPIKVNSEPQQADKITYEVSTVKSPGAKKTDPDGTVWIEIPKTNSEVQVTFSAQIPQNGNYTITKPTFKNDPNNKWSARISGANVDGSYSKYMTAPEETFMIYISAKESAAAAKLALQATCDNDNTIKGSTDKDVRPK